MHWYWCETCSAEINIFEVNAQRLTRGGEEEYCHYITQGDKVIKHLVERRLLDYGRAPYNHTRGDSVLTPCLICEAMQRGIPTMRPCNEQGPLSPEQTCTLPLNHERAKGHFDEHHPDLGRWYDKQADADVAMKEEIEKLSQKIDEGVSTASSTLTTVPITEGATRSEKAPEHHLNPMFLTERISRRFGLGAKTHGAWNWTNAFRTEESARQWCDEAYNHLCEHQRKMMNGIDPQDDHVGAMGWALEMFAYAEALYGKKWTELAKAKEE